MGDKAAVCNFPQALNKQKTMNCVSPLCTRARDENCFKSLAYDPVADCGADHPGGLGG